MKIAWKARANEFFGNSPKLRMHGEVEVPDDATDEQIDVLVREDMARGFDFQWRIQQVRP